MPTVCIPQSTPFYSAQTMESGPMDMFPAGTVVRFRRSSGDIVVDGPAYHRITYERNCKLVHNDCADI